jgi:hypothetical protein
MVKFEIGKYIITNDTMNYILSKTGVTAEGTPLKQPVTMGFYSDLKHCLKAIKRDIVMNGDTMITNFDELQAKDKEIEKQFDEYLSKQVGEY